MKARKAAKNSIWLMLAMVAGLVTPTTGHGQGSIVYVNPPDHLMYSRGEATRLYDVDMNGDGNVDVVFQVYTQFDIYSTTGNRTVAIPTTPPDIGSFSIPLTEGFEIGSNLATPLAWASSYEWGGVGSGDWVGQTLHVFNDAGALGYWQPNITAYLGVEFQIEDNVHYGWIQVTTLPFPTANGGTILDWAYNSIPGQPILAGQVPEPSTWVLLMGGFAVLVLNRLRRSS